MSKKCCRCHQLKDPEKDFYLCAGKYRPECKPCTISYNVSYQKRTQAWKYRYRDDAARQIYMKEYYQKNKQKFEEYRREFKERHPDYFREYNRKRKERRER